MGRRAPGRTSPRVQPKTRTRSRRGGSNAWTRFCDGPRSTRVARPRSATAPSSRLDALPADVLRKIGRLLRADDALVELHACSRGLRRALDDLDLWREALRVSEISFHSSFRAAKILWRGRAWDWAPRKLFLYLESLLWRDDARKFTKTDDYLACALIPISTRSPRWRDAWADDIDTRRDTFLSFFLTRNALSALWEHRDDEEGISVFDDDDSGNCPLAWRVWVGLCRLDCDADLIAEVVRVLPYNYERLAGDVRLAEDCLKGFEYDRAWDHDDNFRFEAHYSATHVLPMRPGEALLNLGHASGRVAPRGVARS